MKVFPLCKRLFIVISFACLQVFAIAQTAKQPNILWLTSEDNNVDWIGCYGNEFADTPNIDQLARDGFQYMNAFANAPVCAPSRSTWITGIHAISTGTHPMRSRNEIPHDLIQYYPDHLRANGYYTGNSTKTDYNIGGRNDVDCWDNPEKVDWDSLPTKQPFFQVINFAESHESRAQGDVDHTIHDPKNTKLRAYHPDLPDIRKNYAKYHDAVKRMDTNIGEVLRQLEERGLADSTIVVYNSDHGGVLPRSKRFLFQSGLHAPLIIRIPEAFKHLYPAKAPGEKIDRLISFIDMPKTWLSLTHSSVPDYMQGTIFLGEKIEPEQPFHFAYRGRMDERNENARSVSDKRFLYIRNYMPYVPWMQRLNYLWKMKATEVWENHVASGKATETEARFFHPKGWSEELYDMQADPDNVRNLAANPEYAETIASMRKALQAWQAQIHDTGLLPESEMLKRAADNETTIYEMVRNSDLYNLPSLLEAADLALEQNPKNLSTLRSLLKSDDSGERYWGIVGCFLLDDVPSGYTALEDESHETRAMAAWILIRNGDKQAGLDCLDKLLKEHSYASLKVLNMVDWIGDDAKPLLPTIKAIKYENYELRMQTQLLQKYGLLAEAE